MQLTYRSKDLPVTYIYVIHENAAWLEPLAVALDGQGLPWHDWFLDRVAFDPIRDLEGIPED